MRLLTIAYSVTAVWIFGWLAGRFGLLPSLFAAIILFIPAAFAWRMVASDRTIRRREYGYLGVVTMLALCAIVFVVAKWYDTGMDRLAMFDREYHEFRNRVHSMPEYNDVEVSYTSRKGGRVYLEGHVPNKDSHDRLLQMIEWMIRNNDSGYHDGVEYPGKPNETEVAYADSKGDEQTDSSTPPSATNGGNQSSREEDHDPFGDSAADDSSKTSGATFEELIELMESTIGKTERPDPEEPFDPPLTNADIGSEDSSTRLILDQIVSFVFMSADLKDEREFYGTAADTRCALVSSAGYGIPWPEWYTPKMQGMKFVRASEEKHVEPSNRRLLGIRIDKLHRSATTNEDDSPHLSGPVEVTLLNAGGDPDDVIVQGGASLYFRSEWKNGEPRLIYEGLRDP